ncbi:hypothetical protein Ae201684P_021665 [Aphanomyces euteiches]|nr:hypothetical protein Ae201684P_021665 [Aphanomyces euteiches]
MDKSGCRSVRGKEAHRPTRLPEVTVIHGKFIECAAAGQLLLLDVKPFPFSELAALGYGSVGYRLEERAFHSENGLVHVFVPESKTVRSRFSQTWSRDVSLWLGPNFSVGAVESIFREIMGDGFDLKLEKRDEYQCPKSQRQSYMFHVVFTSNVPFGPRWRRSSARWFRCPSFNK